MTAHHSPDDECCPVVAYDEGVRDGYLLVQREDVTRQLAIMRTREAALRPMAGMICAASGVSFDEALARLRGLPPEMSLPDHYYGAAIEALGNRLDQIIAALAAREGRHEVRH